MARSLRHRPLLATALVSAACFALGASTSWAQGWLPYALAPLANSVSGWTLLLVLAVAAVGPSWRHGAVLGVVGFVLLVLGYTYASRLRGLYYDPVLWGSLGLVAGPFVGAAVAQLRSGSSRARAIAAGLLAALFLCDAVTGLFRVLGTTGPTWWLLSAAVGLGLLCEGARRLDRPRERLLLVVGVAVAVGAGQVAWSLLLL